MIISQPMIWPPIARFVVGQAVLIGAISIHQADLKIAIPVRGKGDLATIGRPGRLLIIGVVIGQIGGVAAIQIHDVDLIVAITICGEGDLASVWWSLSMNR